MSYDDWVFGGARDCDPFGGWQLNWNYEFGWRGQLCSTIVADSERVTGWGGKAGLGVIS